MEINPSTLNAIITTYTKLLPESAKEGEKFDFEYLESQPIIRSADPLVKPVFARELGYLTFEYTRKGWSLTIHD